MNAKALDCSANEEDYIYRHIWKKFSATVWERCQSGTVRNLGDLISSDNPSLESKHQWRGGTWHVNHMSYLNWLTDSSPLWM